MTKYVANLIQKKLEKKPDLSVDSFVAALFSPRYSNLMLSHVEQFLLDKFVGVSAKKIKKHKKTGKNFIPSVLNRMVAAGKKLMQQKFPNAFSEKDKLSLSDKGITRPLNGSVGNSTENLQEKLPGSDKQGIQPIVKLPGSDKQGIQPIVYSQEVPPRRKKSHRKDESDSQIHKRRRNSRQES